MSEQGQAAGAGAAQGAQGAAGAAQGAQGAQAAQGQNGQAAQGANGGANGGQQSGQAQTVLDAGAAGAKGAGEQAAAWPEEGFMPDWRERMAGGNAEKLKFLQRFTSPATATDALIVARRQLSEGKKGAAPGADAKPEEIAAYRKENAIPEKIEGYLEKLPDGLVIGEADKPIVDAYLTEMHKQNVPVPQVQSALKFYYDNLAAQQAKLADENNRMRDETNEALTVEWGPEKKGNINAITNMLATFPDEAKNAVLNAVDLKGIAIFNNPHVVKAFAQLARTLNPNATITPNTSGDIAKSVADEIAKIELAMRTDGGRAYWADNAMQARYRELVAFRDSQPKAAA